MLQALTLQGTEKVLEIGTGTGYQAALLSCLCQHVHTLEIVPELANHARKTLVELGISNVSVHFADGSHGYASQAPYDAIIVAAGSPNVPVALYDQLKDGGTLLLPIGDRRRQTLTRITKDSSQMRRQDLGNCAFVPLRGTFGWPQA